MSKPKEDPEAKRDRLRERRLSLLERRRSAEKNATGLTRDIQNVYGLGGLSMFDMSGSTKAGTSANTTTTRSGISAAS